MVLVGAAGVAGVAGVAAGGGATGFSGAAPGAVGAAATVVAELGAGFPTEPFPESLPAFGEACTGEPAETRAAGEALGGGGAS